MAVNAFHRSVETLEVDCEIGALFAVHRPVLSVCVSDLHEPPPEAAGKHSVRTFKKQMPLLSFNDYSITVPRQVGNGRCWAEVPHLLNGVRPAIAPCDLPGLHIAGCVKIRVHLHIDLFCFTAAVPIHSSQLLCKAHNYLSYYNKSLRCFQEKTQQFLAMQKNTAIFQCEA